MVYSATVSPIRDKQIIPRDRDAKGQIYSGNQRSIDGRPRSRVFANGLVAQIRDKQVVFRNRDAIGKVNPEISEALTVEPIHPVFANDAAAHVPDKQVFPEIAMPLGINPEIS